MALRALQPRALHALRVAAARRFSSGLAPIAAGARRASNRGALYPGALVGAAAIAAVSTTVSLCESEVKEEPFVLPEGLHKLSSVNEFDVVLYQYQPCPFCNKVRAFLDYHKIPYKVVEVNPLFKKELAFSKYKKVPVAVIQGVQVNDSGNIINVLSALLPDQAPAQKPASGGWLSSLWPSSTSANSTSTDAPTADSQVWCKWVDDTLVHLLPANIYRTPSEALHSFDYLLEHGNFPTVQRDAARYVGAAVMHLLSKYKLNKKYGITQPREQLYAAVNTWLAAVGDKPFHGGAAPSQADLAVFGVLRSIRDYDVFAELKTNTPVMAWYQRMADAVGAPSQVAA